jgi:hypothetical protein
MLAASPWLALVAVRWGRASASEFDRIWIEFRDQFGLVWGQRVREQFNSAAMNAGWSVQLDWRGLRPREAQCDEATDTLRALLKRFGVRQSRRFA